MAVLDEFRDTVSGVAARVGPSVVGLGRGWGVGSGVVIAEDQVLTNAHNLRGDEATVTFADGRRETGEVAGSDRDPDLAVIAVGRGDAPPGGWGEGDPPRLGPAGGGVANPGGGGRRAAGGVGRGRPARARHRGGGAGQPGRTGTARHAGHGLVLGPQLPRSPRAPGPRCHRAHRPPPPRLLRGPAGGRRGAAARAERAAARWRADRGGTRHPLRAPARGGAGPPRGPGAPPAPGGR